MDDPKANAFGLKMANKIANANDEEWAKLFHNLYSHRKLSTVIHEINALQHSAQHARIANAAIKRMGFDL